VDEAIVARRLVVRRGDNVVLRGLDFSVPEGAITGLLGPSGCGKTTLMRSVVGVQIVESGEIEVLGRPAGSAQLRPQVGYVTQAPSVYGDLTVTENLEYFAAVLDAEQGAIEEVIGTVGLGEARGRVVSNLSGGQRSRVSLATALLARPRVLVLDEPTTGLDPFEGLAASGTTLLVSSHVMDEADHCERLLLMREGELIATETPEGLRRRTGQQGLEEAFLALIEEREAG
jgi:ABC-2 type transport system ATP-binding protein